MKLQHVALITIAVGLCFAVIPQLIPAKKPAQTWNPPKVEKPITTTNGVNPYQDAVDNQYQMTDESLGTIDETYGQPQPQIKLPRNVKITIEVTNPATSSQTAKQ